MATTLQALYPSVQFIVLHGVEGCGAGYAGDNEALGLSIDTVDCSECDRGGNGQARDKCSCGWKAKRAKRGGCYLGTLRDGLSL